MGKLKLDEIGYWSEVKLDIIKKYASAYSTIISKQDYIKGHIYIDGFAGAGTHISKTTKEFVPGSPRNALNVKPPFKEYHFIDLKSGKVNLLQEMSKKHQTVKVYKGDCNKILLEKVFTLVKYEDYQRALCLLDPYGLHLNWEVIHTAGQMKTIEIFLNFPMMDMNMNVLWKDPDKVNPRQIARMDAFWGNHTWHDVAYTKTRGLFDDIEEKASSEAIVKAFQERLRKVAGFAYVPDAIPMRNLTGVILYYLFFASPNNTGAKIVKDIFDKYRNRGVV